MQCLPDHCIAQQTMELFFDDLIAFTNVRLQSRTVKDRDVTTAVTDQTGALKISGGFGDALAANAKHAGNQFLGNGQFLRGQSIKV